MTSHIYDSGVGWDTHPDDRIYPCCDKPSGADIHDVARHGCPDGAA